MFLFLLNNQQTAEISTSESTLSLHATLPISLTIIVKPPFWLSPFAYAIYILLSLSLIIAIFMIMRRKQQRIIKEKKREMEITKLQEMNDAKINFFTNISHDLRTPLSLIITPLEKLLSVKAIKEYSDDLNMIHRNAMVLMNEMDQLLDIRKLDKNKVMLNTSYGNISEFVKDICHSFRTLAVKDGITISLRIDNPVIEMNFDKNKMQRDRKSVV